MSDESIDRIVGCYIHSGDLPAGAAVYRVDGAAWTLTIRRGGFIEVLGDSRGDSEMRFGPGTKIRALDGGGFVIEGDIPDPLAITGHPGPVPSNCLMTSGEAPAQVST